MPSLGGGWDPYNSVHRAGFAGGQVPAYLEVLYGQHVLTPLPTQNYVYECYVYEGPGPLTQLLL